ncbi:LysE family transporter [Photobacterium sp. 1_MG-2023]|uniref:LysE family transporter n=1 Tax=Photobacterium sp. 1_MG-2023 TaxID=3062646 RepID=UPI0026E305A7|nr:LysE family transporter [Photobacterium sp. 1_MG-2023]MDO6708978.1 LysE family transporter [Photobacterium sp. 1_MG-2023]
MTYSIFIILVFSCIAFSFSPGAGAIATMSRAIDGDASKVKYNIVGLQLALMFHLVIVTAGLGAMVASSDFAFNVIKYSGALYLLYLGFMKIKNSDQVSYKKENVLRNKGQSVLNGFLVNISNPKSIVFLVAFIPQFIVGQGGFTQYFQLGLVVLVIDTLAMFTYYSFANSLMKYLTDETQKKRLNILFGSMFILLSILLLISERN